MTTTDSCFSRRKLRTKFAWLPYVLPPRQSVILQYPNRKTKMKKTMGRVCNAGPLHPEVLLFSFGTNLFFSFFVCVFLSVFFFLSFSPRPFLVGPGPPRNEILRTPLLRQQLRLRLQVS